VVALLAVEFLDELVFGVREAAWPLIRRDLGLGYLEIGLLLTIPEMVSTLLEPTFGLLGDAGRRRRLVLGGGVAFALALALVSVSWTFGAMLAAFAMLYPASGAFVGLSQATLMDQDADAQERNMARWVVAGSVAAVIAPLILSASAVLGAGWRPLFAAMAVLSVPLVLLLRRARFDDGEPSSSSFREAFRAAVRALRRREVLRWLLLLEFGDLVGDVLFGFLALYLVDVGGLSVGLAGVAVAVWTGAGLAGDLLLVPLLARVDGVVHLRRTALAVLAVYPAFLVLPGLGPKLAMLALLGLLHAGWYAIPQARLFGEMPGSSGTAVALSNVTGLLGTVLPLAVAAVAARAGLGTAMWILALGPLAMVFGLPRRARAGEGARRVGATG
jgi:FSR family fosmidomycin resistance protein-like MFS transporter